MLSRLFSNYLKIIKIKDRRLFEFYIENFENLLKIKSDILFSPQLAQNIKLCIFMLSRLF